MATIHKPFNYVPALHTNIARTIQREKKRLKDLELAKEKAAAESLASVTQLPTTKLRSGSSAKA
jgi:hypothetical protein